MTNPPTARSKPAPHPSYNQGCTLTATTDVPLSDLAVQLGITVSHQTNRLGSRIRKAPTSPGRCSGRQNCRTIDPNAPPWTARRCAGPRRTAARDLARYP